jgi:hypothetical protein
MPDESTVTDALRNIKKGERVVYYTGSSLSECSKRVMLLVKQLNKDGDILLHLRRKTPPATAGMIDRRLGIGSFEYIAVGRR